MFFKQRGVRSIRSIYPCLLLITVFSYSSSGSVNSICQSFFKDFVLKSSSDSVEYVHHMEPSEIRALIRKDKSHFLHLLFRSVGITKKARSTENLMFPEATRGSLFQAARELEEQ